MQQFYLLRSDNNADYGDEITVAEEVELAVERCGQDLEIADVPLDLVKDLPYHHCQWVYLNFEQANARQQDEPIETYVCPDGYLIVAEHVISGLHLVYAPTVKASEARVELEFGADDAGGVYLYDHNGDEIVSWTTDEFDEHDGALPAALNALRIFYEQGADVLADILGK